jgi:hypothetical protein
MKRFLNPAFPAGFLFCYILLHDPVAQQDRASVS